MKTSSNGISRWQTKAKRKLASMYYSHATNVSKVLARSSMASNIGLGKANSAHEKQADKVADKVMSGLWQGIIQRKCDQCEQDGINDGNKEGGEKKGGNKSADTIQAKLATSVQTESRSSVSNSELKNASTNGSPLPSEINKHMSESIGYDFSDVRVHNNQKAKHLNQQLRSRAFTYGNDIFFNHNQYQPSSKNGQHLLAHELTHVVQQNRGQQLIQKQDGPPSEIPLTSDVGAFWFRANENGRIEFVYGLPEMPLIGERGLGFRCENGSCSPIVSGDASIGSLGDTYTPGEAMALLRGEDPELLPNIGNCAPAQRNALGICCPNDMIANGLNCEPLAPFIPTLPGGIPNPDGPTPSIRLGDPMLPGQSVFPLHGLTTINNFEFNQHTVPSSEASQIRDLALRISILSMRNTGTVLITGYADAVGSDEENMQLGLRRANAVRDSLIAEGVPASAIIVDSEGETNLIVDTDQAEVRNRRVEVFYSFTNLHTPPSLGDNYRLTLPSTFSGVEPGPF